MVASLSESASATAAIHDAGRESRPYGEAVDDRFVLRGMLGRGGMGEVYEAEHVTLGKRFAIKFLRIDQAVDPECVERFSREARLLAKIASDHVVSTVDYGVRDGTPFLVMELLRGADLRTLLQQSSPLTVPRAVGLIVDACLGVRAAHRAGLVHRDLKPSNLFVTRSDRGAEVCKVLDFGVARLVASESTRRGGFTGTIRYMAPEQLLDGGHVDHRTDVHALGCILFECLTGRPAFDDGALERVIFAILHARRPSVLDHGVSCQPQLDRVITRAMARKPEDRFASVADLIDALDPFLPRRKPHTALASADDPTLNTSAPARVSGYSVVRPLTGGLLAGLICSASVSGVTGENRTTVVRTESGLAIPPPAPVPVFDPRRPTRQGASAVLEMPLTQTELKAPAQAKRDRPDGSANPTRRAAAPRPAPTTTLFDETSPYRAKREQ